MSRPTDNNLSLILWKCVCSYTRRQFLKRYKVPDLGHLPDTALRVYELTIRDLRWLLWGQHQ